MEQNEFNFLIARYKGLPKEIEFAKNKMWAVTSATRGSLWHSNKISCLCIVSWAYKFSYLFCRFALFT